MTNLPPSSAYTGLEVAVIGMAGRFPGAADVEEYWNNLVNGVESISYFEAEELRQAGWDEETLGSPGYVPARGVVSGVEYFDSNFFGYSPLEADMMDPQIRFLHECAWHALEDAGYNPHTYPGNIGICVGASPNFNWEAHAYMDERFDHSLYPYIHVHFLATLLAYKLDLKGPAYVVNTACSTSLTAIHQACRAILTGESRIMLAGGVSITAPIKQGYTFSEGMIMAPDGHCRPFDDMAQGTVGGCGAGIVVLKRLKDALADGDNIQAVIKGSAMNNDGSRKVGYTAPSVEAQALAVRQALKIARVMPESLSYVEAHGTGTVLGDPTEIQALTQAFGSTSRQFCGIGSVKSNIGHLDAASGIAGFIKTVLILKHRRIPPTLHFECPNQHIDFVNSPFYVADECMKLERGPQPLRAGVNALGIGGTNVHIILEQAPCKEQPTGTGQGPYILPLSALTGKMLSKMADRLEAYLDGHANISLLAAAHTLQTGRKHLVHRCILICERTEEGIPLSVRRLYPSDLEECLIPSVPFLHELVNPWLQGREVNWGLLYMDISPPRMSLPGYSFEREPYNTKVVLLKDRIRSGEDYNPLPAAKETTGLSLASDYQRSSLSAPYEPPVTPFQQLSAEVLTELTGIGCIGIHDNFYELSMDSIKAIRLASRLHKSGFKVGVQQVMNFPTIAALEEQTVRSAREGLKAREQRISAEFVAEQSRRLSSGVINGVKERYPEAEAVYPLSPMQHLILAQNIAAYKKGNDVFALVFKITGGMDAPMFLRAWEEMVKRHPILRTAFVWRKVPEPLQVVYRQAIPEIRELDWSCLTPGEQQLAVQAYIAEERGRGFKVTEAPLMRGCLARTDQLSHYFIWTFQHSLIDGWSMHLIINELLIAYKALVNHSEPALEESKSFHSYIEWLQQQDLEPARQFWQQEFAGYVPARPQREDKKRTEGSDFNIVTQELVLPESFMEAAAAFSKNHGLTLNTLVQTAWGVLISHTTGSSDVIMGVETSGRSEGLDGIEGMAGLFITVVPVRITIPGTTGCTGWMKQLQTRQLAMRSYEYATTQQISKWSGVAMDLLQQAIYERTLVFQNIPMELEEKEYEGITMSIEGRVSQINIPLRLYVTPASTLTLLICYNESQYEYSAVNELLKQIAQLLQSIIRSNDLNFGELLKTLN
ncbi:condensation domain-containing protein [Paenibacillus sp. FSL M7-0896]|uniref:condensation domain-containing protein n=1 Tax=Paenibacillus sp. FSL M7-0896 TaxID=2921610 RepID=UPI0030DB1754